MSQLGAVVSASSMGNAVLTITGDSGFPVGPDGSGNIDLVGGTANVSVAGDAGTNTLSINVASSVLPFNVASVNTNMSVNNVYFPSATAYCIELICVVADTTWVARNNIGNFVPF